MNDENKGYGIVIPAEWKASDFNGSLDDLFAWIVELDKKLSTVWLMRVVLIWNYWNVLDMSMRGYRLSH